MKFVFCHNFFPEFSFIRISGKKILAKNNSGKEFGKNVIFGQMEDQQNISSYAKLLSLQK